jgi:hypothetical protein
MSRASRRSRVKGCAGQTANEMLMIMGLLTAILISVTGIVIPTMSFVVERLTKHLLIYVGSP